MWDVRLDEVVCTCPVELCVFLFAGWWVWRICFGLGGDEVVVLWGLILAMCDCCDTDGAMVVLSLRYVAGWFTYLP